MSILLYAEVVSPTKSKVLGINYNLNHPITGVSQEVIDSNIIVESVPESDYTAGKTAVHYVNPQTKEQWYEYVDVPLTQEEQLAELKTHQEATDAMVLQLLMEGMVK